MTREEILNSAFPKTVGGMVRPDEPIPTDWGFSTELPQFLRNDLNLGDQENAFLRQILSNDKIMDALIDGIKNQLADCDLRLVTQALKGLMSPADKTKLDGIQTGATNYAHPANHPASMITQDASRRMVSDTQINSWTAKANANHGNHVPALETANNARYLRNDGTFQTVTPANIGITNDMFGLNLLQRNTAYEVGDRAFYAGLPSWACLECVTKGTTASTDIVLPQNVNGGGGALVVDGTVLWIIDDMRELCTVGDVVGKTYLPAGYVKANGATVQRADYPRLVNLANRYNLWTTTPATYPALYGKGNGSTTFVLPDWRGVVMRFVDDGKGYDPGRVLGTYQLDAMQNLTGNFEAGSGECSGIFANAWNSQAYCKRDAGYGDLKFVSFNASRQARTAAENRMKNIAVLAVMRY